jgi:outer membrane protein, heavy metal efflux system
LNPKRSERWPFRVTAYGLAAFVAALFAGCARFESRPINPSQTAAQFEQRTLANPALRSFLETNLHRPFGVWPPAVWNEETLTLVAFYYHPILEVARADWQVAAAGTETAAERPNPTVTATGIYEPATAAYSPWIPGLTFDLPIETAGKRRFRMDQARHLTESARLNLAITAWQVRSQLRASLLDFVAAHERVSLLERRLGLQQQLADRLEHQFQAGAISGFERNTARLALVRTRADLADAQRSSAEARPRLSDALGLPVVALDGANFHFDLDATGSAEDLTTAEARTLALRGRPDILAGLSDYAAAQSALQLETAKQYPDIHLNPGYSWNAGSTGEHDWQLGATVELPLLSRHQGPIAEAAARRQASAARFLALQAKVIGEIDGALASFRASQTNAAALKTLVAAQQAQHQAVLDQFRAGAVDQLEVTTAELEFDAADLTRFEAEVKVQQALGALENAIRRPLALPPGILQPNRKDEHARSN